MCTVTMVVFTKVYTAKGVGLRLHAHMLRSACGAFVHVVMIAYYCYGYHFIQSGVRIDIHVGLNGNRARHILS